MQACDEDKVEIVELLIENGADKYAVNEYNDSLNCLIFRGFYNSAYFGKSEEVTQNWGEFLEKNFSNLYDFSSFDAV